MIGLASFMLTLLCVVLAFIVGLANGLLILAVIFGLIFAWAIGAFTGAFWD